MLGYDMRKDGKKRHFFGSHPRGLERESNYRHFIECYKTIDPARYGLTIVNCSPGSALRHFPCADLAQALQKKTPAGAGENATEGKPAKGINQFFLTGGV